MDMTEKVFSITQYFMLSYYFNFNLIEIQLNSNDFYENYLMTVKYSGLQEHKGRIYTKKQFYEIISILKDYPMLSIEDFEGKYPKVYIFINYLKDKNRYKFIVFDTEKEDKDNRYMDYSKEKYRNALLNVVNPTEEFTLSVANEFIKNFESLRNNITTIKCTEEEIIYKVRVNFEDILSDIYGFEKNFVNPKLIRKYLKEDNSSKFSYSWKGAKDKIHLQLEITYNDEYDIYVYAYY